MDFRTRIKDICQSKGITQKDLADRLGITDISLNKTLRGDYPQLQSLERIANALNVPITELFEQPDTSIITCPNCGTKLEIREVDPVAQKLAKEYNVSTEEILNNAEFAKFVDALPENVRKDILNGKIKVK